MNESEDVARKTNSLVAYILISFVACVALVGLAKLQGDHNRANSVWGSYRRAWPQWACTVSVPGCAPVTETDPNK